MCGVLLLYQARKTCMTTRTVSMEELHEIYAEEKYYEDKRRCERRFDFERMVSRA